MLFFSILMLSFSQLSGIYLTYANPGRGRRMREDLVYQGVKGRRLFFGNYNFTI